jgi:hypothetical protein
LLAILGEDVALLELFGAFLARQRRAVEGDVADQVEGVVVPCFLPTFLGQRFEQTPWLFQFLDDGLLACRRRSSA